MSKRIAYCIPGLYNSGGMERVLSVKANYLAQAGYEIHIITTDQMGRSIYFPLDERIQTHHLDLDYEGSNGGPLHRKVWAFLSNQPRYKRLLTELLECIQPDITISMFGHEASFLPDIKAGGRKILEYHFSKLKRLQYGRTGLWGLIDRWRTHKDEAVVRRYDHFVVLTEEDKALWGEVPGICVIPNPKPFETTELATTEHHQVLAAGRYCHQKNFEELLYIWQDLAPRYPDWKLAIYGNGEDRPKLEALARELQLGASLELAMPTAQMREVYLQSSIYAMTSRYEGLPMVLIEAQTMGLPIVSYACKCGPRDIIHEGQDGYVLEEGDRAGFATALSRLMDDAELRQRMGRAAREASARYDLECIMQQWLCLIH
ncbi:MAG: glycosyltransferase family 4 protein [Porphyromonas sp.]|nr:glycosyltransferase family 4 protein [Porphyromonas sp.]